MIFDKIFSHGKILETALKATEYTNKAIIENISNADTPGYKAKSVKFESALKSAIDSKDEFGNIDLSSVRPKITTSGRNSKTRLDGNSVDVESEMVQFYKNATKYDVIINSVTSNSAATSAVLR